LGRRWAHLDILVNNAAQTVRRPPEYHRDVRAAERTALHGRAATVTISGTRPDLPAGVPAPDEIVVPPGGPLAPPGRALEWPAGWRGMAVDAVEALFPAGRVDGTMEVLFPAGRVDETGEPLDLRASNS